MGELSLTNWLNHQRSQESPLESWDTWVWNVWNMWLVDSHLHCHIYIMRQTLIKRDCPLHNFVPYPSKVSCVICSWGSDIWISAYKLIWYIWTYVQGCLVSKESRSTISCIFIKCDQIYKGKIDLLVKRANKHYAIWPENDQPLILCIILLYKLRCKGNLFSSSFHTSYLFDP